MAAATNRKSRNLHRKLDSLADFDKFLAKLGMCSTVSVLIPGEDSNFFLLKLYDQRGWWLPHDEVKKSETIKVAAQRVASEHADTKVSIQALLKSYVCRVPGMSQGMHFVFLCFPIRVPIADQTEN